MKISGIYKITNTITGDFYIGSSNDVKERWACHKCQSTWNDNSNKQLYQDMQKFGVDKFSFQVLAEVEADSLKEMEQRFIETLNPTYNDKNAKGLDIERHKESHRKASKKYEKTNKGKESKRKYQSQLCFYSGEVLTLNALSKRFRKAGIPHPMQEAKKYLLQ